MNPFLTTYSLANRTGLLNFPTAQSLFSHAYFAYKKWIEDPYTPLVQKSPELFKGGNILDVGANIGYTAALFAKVVSPGFRVYAFEPEDRNFKMLKHSVSRGILEGTVIPICAAVGDKNEMGELWLNPEHHADHRMVTPSFHGKNGARAETQRIPIIRLDDFCSKTFPDDPVRLIKIDVQGYEECVCRGMQQLLISNPQAFVGLEYYPHGMESLGFKGSTVLHFFEERDYFVYSLSRQHGLQKVQYADIVKIIGATGYVDLLFSKSVTILDGVSR